MRESEHRMIKKKSNREYGEVWRMEGGRTRGRRRGIHFEVLCLFGIKKERKVWWIWAKKEGQLNVSEKAEALLS